MPAEKPNIIITSDGTVRGTRIYVNDIQIYHVNKLVIDANNDHIKIERSKTDENGEHVLVDGVIVVGNVDILTHVADILNGRHIQPKLQDSSMDTNG